LKPGAPLLPDRSSESGGNELFKIAWFTTQNLCSAEAELRDSPTAVSLRKPEWINQTGSGMYHPIVKELVLPGQQEGVQTNPDSTERFGFCQAQTGIDSVGKMATTFFGTLAYGIASR
jgi:hypothetical protein